MVDLDGDIAYDNVKAKIEDSEPLSKQDMMSIVFLPLMRSSLDKRVRLERSIELSKEINDTSEQLQIQAMINLLAEKFIKDKVQLMNLKEVLNMTAVAEMIREDKAIEIAKKMLKRKTTIQIVAEDTGLDESIIKQLQDELNN